MSEAEPTTLVLDKWQRKMLRRLVRDAYKKWLRNRRSLIGKYGDETDLTASDQKGATIRATYEALGGDLADVELGGTTAAAAAELDAMSAEAGR